MISTGSGFGLSELCYGSFANCFSIYIVPWWKLMAEDVCRAGKCRVMTIMCSLWLPQEFSHKLRTSWRCLWELFTFFIKKRRYIHNLDCCILYSKLNIVADFVIVSYDLSFLCKLNIWFVLPLHLYIVKNYLFKGQSKPLLMKD